MQDHNPGNKIKFLQGKLPKNIHYKFLRTKIYDLYQTPTKINHDLKIYSTPGIIYTINETAFVTPYFILSLNVQKNIPKM